jgi:hypothetical protein
MFILALLLIVIRNVLFLLVAKIANRNESKNQTKENQICKPMHIGSKGAPIIFLPCGVLLKNGYTFTFSLK